MILTNTSSLEWLEPLNKRLIPITLLMEKHKNP